jgi:hypothetical protein
MTPRVSTAEAPARNPIARSLALAVLGVALVGAAIMGAVVFAVLLGLFVVGYLASLVHAWWRLFRAQRRVAKAEQLAASPTANPDYIQGEYEVVEAAVDAAPRGPGGTA